eukprot:CAMPEP_0173359120 /NCGR_PEP_ID=MMETSP1144-20121109/19855_1 /TAXON_ID=483371 /ORGANISM="non described non described, Strain CCMP2298" /LENGTH=86 /DNA_ID=CAMNT_0014308327 /DNA_START=552 /DNA_END=812 /DNA_ORIENTATION=-
MVSFSVLTAALSALTAAHSAPIAAQAAPTLALSALTALTVDIIIRKWIPISPLCASISLLVALKVHPASAKGQQTSTKGHAATCAS